MLSKKLMKLVNTNMTPEGKKPLPCMVQIGKRDQEFTVYVTGIGGNFLSTLGTGKNLNKALKNAIKQTKTILKSLEFQKVQVKEPKVKEAE